MVINNRNKEDYSKFEYFDLNGLPIRVVYDGGPNPIGADTVDPKTGKLIKRASLISPTRIDPICKEITEEEFYALCEKRVREED